MQTTNRAKGRESRERRTTDCKDNYFRDPSRLTCSDLLGVGRRPTGFYSLCWQPRTLGDLGHRVKLDREGGPPRPTVSL